VFAVAFAHVHDVAHWAHQPDWATWLIASTGELMAIASILEIRHRSRRVPATGRRWMAMFPPVLTLIAAIGISGAANLAAATGLATNPGPWVQIMAVWPVVAFALVAFTKATRPHAVALAASEAGDLDRCPGAGWICGEPFGAGRGGDLAERRCASVGHGRRGVGGTHR